MFFILSKVLRFLLSPLSWIVLMMAFALIKKERKYLKWSFIALLFFSNPLIPELLMKALEAKPVNEPSGHYDVAIVLTGFTHASKQVPGQIQFAEGADRITEAIKLYKKGKVGKIVISGGSGSILYPELSESKAVARFVVDMGVPEEDVFAESHSRNTYENAKFTKEFLDQANLSQHNLLLITSAFHMRRASGCFHKIGLSPVCFPVDYLSHDRIDYTSMIPSAKAFVRWDILISEWVGFYAYWLMGYL